MNIKNEIWILADNRIGTFSQAIGLAQEMKIRYKIISLDYTLFAKLPNFLLKNTLLAYTKKTVQQINNFGYFPSYVISSGRRSSILATYIKKISKNNTKIIQIMNPNLNFNLFDHVIIPHHDSIDSRKYTNVLTSIGSLTRINQQIIDKEKIKFKFLFEKIEKNKIAVMIGGQSKSNKYDQDSIKEFSKIISDIALKNNSILLIISSRRTSKKTLKIIKSNLNCNYKIFDWNSVKNNNPYLAIIGHANSFIITGDSVSMISECCSTGKNVFIFDKRKISTKKHQKFHEFLFRNNYAIKLKNGNIKLKDFKLKKLQESKRIASLIINKNY